MEKIKIALEKARRQREGVTKAASSAATSPATSPCDSAPAFPNDKLVYTQTRTFEVATELFKSKRILFGPEDPATEHYKMLRTHVVQRMRANNWRALAVTSPTQGVGKTLTAVNLAISLAREGNHTVLLVDLDLRRPGVRQCFTEEHLPGISDYLVDGVPISDLLFNPGVERLIVLPGHKSLMQSSEMLVSPRMVALAEEMKHRYTSRIVILDLPPVLAGDDVLAFSPYFDAVLMVVADGETGKTDLERSLELIEEIPILGTVLNKSDAPSEGYGYY